MLTIDQDNIGRDSSYFQSTDTDCFYEVRPQKYFGISQEVAGLHATLKGAGLKDMLDNEGRTWMILRTQMTIGKYASWSDEYDIETWCQEGYRLYCPRWVEARDKKTGEMLFQSKNLWVIMDMIKGRPERPSYIDGRLPYVDPQLRHFDPTLPKFPSEDEYNEGSFDSLKVHPTYYDTDYNRHVNNISYIVWLMESFPHEYLDHNLPEFFDVEWKKQCHLGDEIRVETKKKENSEEYYTKILRKCEDGSEEIAFHGITRWRKRVLDK